MRMKKLITALILKDKMENLESMSVIDIQGSRKSVDSGIHKGTRNYHYIDEG